MRILTFVGYLYFIILPIGSVYLHIILCIMCKSTVYVLLVYTLYYIVFLKVNVRIITNVFLYNDKCYRCSTKITSLDKLWNCSCATSA